MKLHASAASDVGRVRSRNEDAFLVRAEHGWFAVADGMGGHVAGDVASATALEAAAAVLDAGSFDENSMAAAIMAANHAVWQRALAETDKIGMGTTLSILMFPRAAAQLLIGHVGDSRIYRLRGQRLEQLTRDHTAAQEMVEAGRLSRAAARQHPMASMLNRAIGTQAEVTADIQPHAVQYDDRYLLCSDGLTGMIDDDDLAVLLGEPHAPAVICEELIAAANLRGGMDNITTIVVDVVRG